MTGEDLTAVPCYDRTLRAVMWTDAFLSAAVAVGCLVASPVIAVMGLPHVTVLALGVAAIACAALLATCGAVTAVLIALRLSRGQRSLPADLRLPLPAIMRPPQ